MSAKHFIGKNNEFGFTHCPLCGHDDWCMTNNEGGFAVHICRRIENFQNCYGIDNKLYIYDGQTKESNLPRFMEVNIKAFKEGVKVNMNNVPNAKPVKKKVAESPEPLSDSELDKIYRDLMDMLVLEEHHRDNLLNAGWTMELIEKSGVKSFPASKNPGKNMKRHHIAKKLLVKYGSLERVPGFYVAEGKFGQYWTMASASKGAMVFPVYNNKLEVKRLRLRLDVESGGKYRPFSSFFEEEGVNVYLNGTQCGDHMSMFYEKSFLTVPSYWNVFRITEGWKKGFILKEVLEQPTASLPGVEFFILYEAPEFIEFLKDRGVKYIIIDFDCDYKSNPMVRRALMRLIKFMKQQEFIVCLSDWDESLGIKGVDDYLLKGYELGYRAV